MVFEWIVLCITSVNYGLAFPLKEGQSVVNQHRSGLFRARTFVILGVVACLIAAFVVWRTRVTPDEWQPHVYLQQGHVSPVELDESLVSQIVAFCSDCHGMPRPENYPRDAWHRNVRRGFELYARSGRNDLDPPPIQLTVAYFRSRAPERVVFEEPEEAETELLATFTKVHLTSEQEFVAAPGISHLRWTDLEQDGNPVLLACDMRRGYIFAVDLRDRQLRSQVLARLTAPCHVEPCDLDGDHAIDLLVADLGSRAVSDHDHGQVVWLRRQNAAEPYEKVAIASGLGRVADARPVDLDRDGDLDVVVAIFGFSQTGKIVLLRNMGAPQFELEVIDARPGAIHVPVHDLDLDGRLDFVALVSQEYERVEAFINQGNAQFNRQTLWAAPDPTFGSTGIELVDLDQDGDMDVLYTNGDTFDDLYVKPSHGVQWLENDGRQQFAYRRLTDLPGAHRALAGDLDLDGDLDIIAVAWLHDQVLPASAASTPMASVVCLEQTSPGVFVRHTLEEGMACNAALELADFDDDGDLDFAVGLQVSQKLRHLSHWLTVWWNQVVPDTNKS